jgi:Brp/Blh family beta-carotene 15,15'-monooxygenase
MFAKLPIFKFLWSVLFSTISYVFSAPQRSLPLVVGSCVLLLNYFSPGTGNTAGLSVLLVMLFIVGIPHGALDGYITQRKSKLLPFVLRYLSMMLLVILLWTASPLTGLVTFICYSAWHFGETDLKEWGLSSTFLSSLWGALLLGVILISHTQEMNTVFLQMNVPILDLSPETVVLVTRGLILVSIILGLLLRSVPWLISIIALVVGTQLSLALSFGLYFVLQHSVTGWNHLKTSQDWTNKSMWIRSLPFSGGAVLLFLLVFQFDKNSLLEWSSYFLVFLSALSLPHIYFMSRFYQKT